MESQTNRIARYEIQEILGRGAMGVVYRALDPVIGRVVALKTIHLGDAAGGRPPGDSLARFEREAKAAGVLSHPNIVTVYDVGEAAEAGTSYIAMEFVEGRTLRQMVPHGQRMDPDQILEISLQVARALDFAHRHGVVHRDVKPANILVREDGLVKLADFGVARIESSDLTRTGQSVGSPSYIAPEMLQDGSVDGRADLFSLGVILYELLAGEKPFKGETLAALYHRIIAVDPPAPSSWNPELAADWDTLVLRLLAKRPDDRYPTAAALIEDLRNLELGHPLATTPEDARLLPDLVMKELAAESSAPTLEPIVESPGDDPASATIAITSPAVTPHRKAILALGSVACFALAIILSAAVLRKPGLAQPIPPPAVEAADSVEVTVRLAHTLKEGRLAVVMDEEEILDESFQGERGRMMRMQGALSRKVRVAQGRHLFRVSIVDEDGRTWTATTTRVLEPGADAVLFVEVKGLLRKSLDLTWY